MRSVGRTTADSGRTTADSGRTTADSGRTTADSGRTTADLNLKYFVKLQAMTYFITLGDFFDD